MHQVQLEKLNNLIFKKNQNVATELTNLLEMVREFSCLGEIIGRDFEVRDTKGKLVYAIRQKPMKIIQMNTLLKEFVKIKNLDNEREAKKWGAKDKGIPSIRKRGRK